MAPRSRQPEQDSTSPPETYPADQTPQRKLRGFFFAVFAGGYLLDMAFGSEVVSVPSNAAVALVDTTDDTGRQAGMGAFIEFSAAGTIYLGGETVTSADGYVWDGTPMFIPAEGNEILYARAASGTISASVLKQGV